MSAGISAERLLGLIRDLLALGDADDRAKLETVALLASADLRTGELTIAAEDYAAIAFATGHADPAGVL